MSVAMWSGNASRKIVKRILIEGDLELLTPTRFGNGDSAEMVDMPLLVDPLDGSSPLLTGSSIAGALRSYLRSLEQGGFKPFPNIHDDDYKRALSDERLLATVALFGGIRMDDDGEQSALIISDARGKTTGTEIRSGVTINEVTGTAEEDFLFNTQLWRAGTKFPLRFELLIYEGKDEKRLCSALAAALRGLEQAEIGLGARKSRGMGQCQVHSWSVLEYDLTTPKGLLAWLNRDRTGLRQDASITKLLSVPSVFTDQRKVFRVQATFKLDGSMLIRSTAIQREGPDYIHLHSYRNGQYTPVVSGTSLAGAMRKRALRITKALGIPDGEALVSSIFGAGARQKQKPTASRLRVAESAIQNAANYDLEPVQGRVKIDRFTGGAYPAALFHEQPLYPQSDSQLKLEISLLEPTSQQIGLLLLLLKDLCVGDLSIGGERSVGRGRLIGTHVDLSLQAHGKEEQKWSFSQSGVQLTFETGTPDSLQKYVDELCKEATNA